MRLDLGSCFPVGKNGKRKALPKQLDFLNKTLDPNGPKFITYCGGVGSGKTMIGCITMLSQAVMHGGDYLIGRQFMPELRATTYKTFLDICPPELIIEHRIADANIVLKSASGKPATIMFRGLEDPEKYRSLNLSGFYVDEGNQISEEAFLLLQGRLRNMQGLRKGIITTNPRGHDWLYMYFVKKDFFKSEEIKKNYYLIQAPSTENVHLPDGYVENLLATYSDERIKREIYGSFDSFEGQVFSEFRRDTHVIKPFHIPANWPRIVGIDHGYRNPAAWIFAAVSPDAELYVYREFYQREYLITEILHGNNLEGKTGVLQLCHNEKIEVAAIDPSVRARSGVKGESVLDEYLEHLPKEFPLIMANNDKTLGINRLKRYLKIDNKIGKPMLYIFDTCTNLIEELVKYRYQELNPRAAGRKAEKEEPYKVDDHAIDALRYLVMTRPEPYAVKEEELQKMRGRTESERKLTKELERMKNPKGMGIDLI